MTRVNVGISVKELPKKLLLAEHREIKRIPNMVSEGRVSFVGIPDKFTLGAGHVKFFYNKLGYIQKRYEEIYQECILRGCDVQYYGDVFSKIDSKLMNDYIPTERDRQLLVQRISERGFELEKVC